MGKQSRELRQCKIKYDTERGCCKKVRKSKVSSITASAAFNRASAKLAESEKSTELTESAESAKSAKKKSEASGFYKVWFLTLPYCPLPTFVGTLCF